MIPKDRRQDIHFINTVPQSPQMCRERIKKPDRPKRGRRSDGFALPFRTWSTDHVVPGRRDYKQAPISASNADVYQDRRQVQRISYTFIRDTTVNERFLTCRPSISNAQGGFRSDDGNGVKNPGGDKRLEVDTTSLNFPFGRVSGILTAPCEISKFHLE